MVDIKKDRNVIKENLKKPNNKKRSQRDKKMNQNNEIPMQQGNRTSKIGPSTWYLGNAPL